MTSVTQSALARRLNVTRQAVHDLVKRGVLEPDANGLIDLDLAKHAELLDGEPFTVVLAVTLHGEAPGNRGLWLRPRIVELID